MNRRKLQRQMSQARVRLNRIARHRPVRLRCAACGVEWLSSADKAPCSHGYQHQVVGFARAAR